MSDTHAQTVPFVRESMLPPEAPPASQRGAVKWVRENLLSSWLNILLTVLSILAVWWIVAHIFPWAWFGIWDAGSLSECRAIRNEIYGEGAEVACWAVLTDRWHQLVFGFYRQHAGYWRPVLALVVFLVGILPVLFTSLPRKLMILTALVPFICFWLIWGGTIWYPVTFILGLVLGVAVYYFGRRAMAPTLAAIAGFVVAVLYFLFLQGTLSAELEGAIPLALNQVPSRDIGGFTLSVIIGLAAIVLSLPLGILLALGRQSDMFLIQKASVVFIEVIRGVPLIVWLFTAQLLLNYFLPPGTNFDLTLRVIIMVTFFSSAYIAEVVRGGLAALPKGQYEGADSLGLNYWQSMRLIVLPQALKISIPGIVNTFIGLFKDTTLVLFIGLYDPLGMAGAIRATTDWNGIYWELFIFIGVMFFIACFSMGRYSLYLERKLRREHR